MVTHDLRNPLCVILGNAEVIAEGAEDSLTREAAGDISVQSKVGAGFTFRVWLPMS